jgi:alkaline phosphatase D
MTNGRKRSRSGSAAVTRRTFLLGGLAVAAGGSLAATGTLATRSWPLSPRSASLVPIGHHSSVPWSTGDPFTLGIASGDPWAHGVVLWTRLAPGPLADDGAGDMPDKLVPVEWQIAKDATFKRPVRSGVAAAMPDLVHAVHVEVDGLEPGTEYFYRFRVGPYLSTVGRTRTAPPPSAMPASCRFMVASCANYANGWYTAYRHIADEDPDVVVFLGDYVYEYPSGIKDPRSVPGPVASTLDEYRLRYSLYKRDPDLRAAHEVAPWVMTLDDHEVVNDWADDLSDDGASRSAFLERRAAAFRAYYEHMPLRRVSVPHGPDMQLYRRVDWGRLATFHVLDTRQYRSALTCGLPSCDDVRNDPRRTITGNEQEHWLLEGLADSHTTWQLLAQQVIFTYFDREAGPGTEFSGGDWNAYVASRKRVIDGIVERHVRNPVVLTGDAHMHMASDIKTNFLAPESPPVGSEFVGTSISSDGDGHDRDEGWAKAIAESPHIKYQSSRRGYVRCQLTNRQLRADMRILPYVSRPGAPVRTGASFVIEEGHPGLHRA